MSQGLIQARTVSGSSLAYTNPVSQGNLLVCAIRWTGTVIQPTVSDNLSNTWTEVGVIASNENGVQLNLILFWALASSTGSCTVTAVTSGLSSVWMALGEFSGANELAIISGSTLGFGVNPPLYAGNQSQVIQATNPPLTTPTGALLVVVATTGNATATWTVDSTNNWYSIAAQGGGIVIAYSLNLYNNAPFCDMTPPTPILNRTGDASTQWIILSAPFTTTSQSPQLNAVQAFDIFRDQYPPYPYGPAQQQ